MSQIAIDLSEFAGTVVPIVAIPAAAVTLAVIVFLSVANFLQGFFGSRR